MDKHLAIQHSMKGNTKRDTSIEILLRHALWHRGVRFRKNVKGILGTPDIAIKKYRLLVFCDGDFWHGKNYTENKFHVNQKFWDNKIRRNIERDLEYTIALRDEGWIVLRYWESDLRNNLDSCVDEIVGIIERQKTVDCKIKLSI